MHSVLSKWSNLFIIFQTQIIDFSAWIIQKNSLCILVCSSAVHHSPEEELSDNSHFCQHVARPWVQQLQTYKIHTPSSRTGRTDSFYGSVQDDKSTSMKNKYKMLNKVPFLNLVWLTYGATLVSFVASFFLMCVPSTCQNLWLPKIIVIRAQNRSEINKPNFKGKRNRLLFCARHCCGEHISF